VNIYVGRPDVKGLSASGQNRRMEQVKLGSSGLSVSRLALGCMSYGSSAWRPWVLDEEASRPFVKRALELGITFFDTADMYSLGRSEEVLGRALKDFTRRSDVVIATKVYFPMGATDRGADFGGPPRPPGPNDRGLSRKHILDAIDASLRRLGTDYVDLYQIHRFDAETPVDETLRALEDVVRSGRARYLGASSMWSWQLAKMLFRQDRLGAPRFVSMQNHYNLIYREEEREMIPLCLDQGLGLIPWSPLARGFLAGNRTPDRQGETLRAKTDDYAHKLYYSDADFAIADRLGAVAAAKGVSRMQIALAWLLGRPGVAAPIVGATKMSHLEEAVKAVDVRLTAEENVALEELYRPRAVVGIR
jgi:aryl-alcohol dehydrogenase (NADP+)